jgi:hypothetical protein
MCFIISGEFWILGSEKHFIYGSASNAWITFKTKSLSISLSTPAVGENV